MVLGLEGARLVLPPSREPVAVILAVIPPGTTRKTAGNQADRTADLTSENNTRWYPMDGAEATHNRKIVDFIRSREQACEAVLVDMTMLPFPQPSSVTECSGSALRIGSPLRDSFGIFILNSWLCRPSASVRR